MAPVGPYDRSFPAALRLLVAQVRMSGSQAREELLHSERSPWGGRLVAPNLGLELRGDWPDALLNHTRESWSFSNVEAARIRHAAAVRF